MSKPVFDTTALSQYASAESIRRGREYYRKGAIKQLVLRGDELRADVEGSQMRPYQVRVRFAPQGIGVSCTCPYEWGGWCKHIVAVLLAYAEQPDRVDIRPPLVEQLAALDRSQLLALLAEITTQIPGLVEVVETAIPLAILAAASPTATTSADSSATMSSAAASRPITPANVHAIRQQARSLLRSRSGYWDGEYDDEESMGPKLMALAEQARPYLDAGDGRAALSLLEAVTDEVRKRWDTLEEMGRQPYDFLEDVASLWVEALLDPALSVEERQDWIKTLASWEEDFNGEGSWFIEAAQTAAQQGWDHPALERILRGEAGVRDLWGDKPPHCADAITSARLRILQRTGQDDAYLNLAKAEQRYDLYALHLLKLDRVQDAIAVGLEKPLSFTELLTLAKALYERGETAAALQIAEQGLQRPQQPNREVDEEWINAYAWQNAQPRGELAYWLRDRAIEQGETDRALAAGVIAFREIPSFAAYRQLAELAGTRWPDIQRELLDYLRRERHPSTETQVDIFLHEDLLDDAIHTVERYPTSTTLARVMDAALTRRPEWVLAQARRQAEPIMNEGRASHYDEAVMWLQKAKHAYQALGQEQDWQAYIANLRDQHRRKYKLIPLMAAL